MPLSSFEKKKLKLLRKQGKDQQAAEFRSKITEIVKSLPHEQLLLSTFYSLLWANARGRKVPDLDDVILGVVYGFLIPKMCQGGMSKTVLGMHLAIGVNYAGDGLHWLMDELGLDSSSIPSLKIPEEDVITIQEIGGVQVPIGPFSGGIQFGVGKQKIPRPPPGPKP